MTGVRSAASTFSAVVDDLVTVFSDLQTMAAAFSDVVARCRANGRQPTVDDLATLRPGIMAVLSRDADWIVGAGVITAPQVIGGTPRWLEWWWKRPGGIPAALRVNLQESAADYYDYVTAEWYAVPQRSRAPHAAGPYVDYLCTNEYTMTLSRPVYLGDELIGMAAGDVLISSLERRLVPALLSLPHPAAIATAQGRVIASSAPEVSAGQRLPAGWHTVLLPDRGAPRPSGADRWVLARP